MDVLARIRQIMKERNCSYYKFAKECDIPEATAYNMDNRNTVPLMPTPEVICKGMGITMAPFFDEDNMVEMTPDLKEIFGVWVNLTPKAKSAILQVLKSMNDEQGANLTNRRKISTGTVFLGGSRFLFQ